MAQAPGYDLFVQALRLQAAGDDADPEKAVRLLEDARSLGLSENDNLTARCMLANASMSCLPTTCDIVEAVPANGLESLPEALAIVSAFEDALREDQRLGGLELGKGPIERGASLRRLSLFWLLQGRFLKSQRGPEAAAAYAEQKLALLSHLQAPPLAMLYIEVAQYYEEAGNQAAVRKLYQRVVDAEDPFDQDSEVKAKALAWLQTTPGQSRSQTAANRSAHAPSNAAVCCLRFPRFIVVSRPSEVPHHLNQLSGFRGPLHREAVWIAE